MKKYICFLFMAFAVILSSCSKEEVTTYSEEWKELNDKAFADMANNTDYQRIDSEGNNGFIYYKVLEEGSGEKLNYSSRLTAHYKGTFIDGTVFDQNLRGDRAPARFAVSLNGANYSQTNPNGYMRPIDGWTVALQHMRKGDKWEVWFPYQLAYGKAGTKTIQPYSTLIFEIEVVDVTLYPPLQ
jgi:FKBP-type peptidyl-prolyl cis-trans isomerases 1